jgi:hypothetical protein
MAKSAIQARNHAIRVFAATFVGGEAAAFVPGCMIGAPAGALVLEGPLGLIAGCGGGGGASAGAALPAMLIGATMDSMFEAYIPTLFDGSSSSCP